MRRSLFVIVATLLAASTVHSAERVRLEEPLHGKVVEAIREAEALNGAKEYAASIALLERVLELRDATSTDVAVTREALAGAYEWSGDLEGARRLVVAVTREPGKLPNPSVDRIWLKRASLGYRTGNHRDAIASIERWDERVDSPTAISYQMLALAHDALDERSEALRYARKSAEMCEAAGRVPGPSIRRILEEGSGAR